MPQTTLFGANGEPVAYLDGDDANTIYLWSGEPVAYLEEEHVYGFNGRHLGWFENGVLWNHGGQKAGFVRGTLPVMAQMEPFKSFKQFKPFKAFREFAPFKPMKLITASDAPLGDFLWAGRP